eukprot:scaffold267502_cov30-Tisochrysis_lutea.AAC.4
MASRRPGALRVEMARLRAELCACIMPPDDSSRRSSLSCRSLGVALALPPVFASEEGSDEATPPRRLRPGTDPTIPNVAGDRSVGVTDGELDGLARPSFAKATEGSTSSPSNAAMHAVALAVVALRE